MTESSKAAQAGDMEKAQRLMNEAQKLMFGQENQ
jgi:hypothetical protein